MKTYALKEKTRSRLNEIRTPRRRTSVEPWGLSLYVPRFVRDRETCRIAFAQVSSRVPIQKTSESR